MLIRCEKCSTLYELDEKLLPPQGAPVQCSKCQFVFKAYPVPPPQPTAPERAANETPVEVTAAGPAGESTEPPQPRRDEFVREGGALANSFDERPSGLGPSRPGGGATGPGGPRDPSPSRTPLPRGVNGEEPKFTADGRPIRKVPFPIAEAPQQGPRTPPMKPAAPKRPIDRRLQTKWVLVAIAIAVIVALAAIAWRGFGAPASSRAPPGQYHALPQGGTPETPPRK